MVSLLAWYLTGYLLLRLAVRRPPSPGAALAFGMALGIPLRLACVVAGIPHFAVVTIQVAVAIALAVVVAVKGKATLPDRPRLAPPGAGLGAMALSAMLVLAAGAGLLVLVRFVGIPPANFDVLSYHIPQATALLEPGSASALLWQPETFYARLPLGGALLEEPFVTRASGGLYGVGLQTFLMACILGTAASAARIVAWFGGRIHARMAAAALIVLHPMGSGAVLQSLQEPILGLLAVGGLELMLNGVGRRRAGRLLIALGGFVAASAAAVKLSAVGVVAIPQGVALVLLLGQRWRRSTAGCSISCLLWGVGAFLAMAPWFLRGLIVAGHPLHPFGGFSDSWTAEQARFVVQVHGPQSILSAGYWSDAWGKISQLGFDFGGVPLMLLGALLALVSPRGRRALPLAVAALLAYLAYLGVHNNPARFIHPGALLLVPLATIAATSLRAPREWRCAPLTILMIGCCAAAYPQLRVAHSFDPVYTVNLRRDILGEYIGPGLIPTAEMAQDLAEDGRLLLIFESRPSLFRGPVESRTVWDQASYAADLKASTDDADFARRLRKRGIHAIFVNEPEWGRYLDFYAAEAMGPGERRFGRITIAGPVSQEEREAGLLHFPPHQAAGLGKREVEILEAFLRTLRQSTIISTTAGRAEIWAARIPPVDRVETSQ
ncbi:hypothetical protein GC173_18415 [bacterium]|nr:hypothetical protein [bacterium]